jgi:histidinol phosphatase-like PHP family hydrolase
MKRIKEFFPILLKDIKNNLKPKVDMHLHTNWTDGQDSAFKMYEEACKKKITHIFFCEHSRKSSGKWFLKFVNEVRNLKKINCVAFVGTEVKVLNFKGKLDLSNRIYKLSDFIMASVHRFPGEIGDMLMTKKNFTKKKAINIEYKLMCAAIKNPKTDILGHPFGMSIKRFDATPSKKLFINIIKLCKKNNVAFEINSAYHKKNLQWLLKECVKYNATVSLGSNAHKVSEIGSIIKKIY